MNIPILPTFCPRTTERGVARLLHLAALGLVTACGATDDALGDASVGSPADASMGAPGDADPPDAEVTPDMAPAPANVTLRGLSEAEMCGHYQDDYLGPAVRYSTGEDPASCAPGAMTAEGLAATRARLDWYRTLYGLPALGQAEPAANEAAQRCALMVAANEALSHDPPRDWRCFDDAGAEMAGRSNLYLGAGTPVSAVDLLVFDFGSEDTLGHRRWVLAPGQRGHGFGFVAGTGGGASGFCQTVRGLGDPPVSWPEPVAYPPPGAFPAALLSYTFQGVRVAAWSIGWDAADFTGARLTLTDETTGAPVPLAADGAFRALAEGFGSSAALWRPANAPPVGGAWRVRIDGIVRRGSRTEPVIYVVELADCGATAVF